MIDIRVTIELNHPSDVVLPIRGVYCSNNWSMIGKSTHDLLFSPYETNKTGTLLIQSKLYCTACFGQQQLRKKTYFSQV